MDIITHEDVIPTLIPNTTMQKRFYDGVPRQYVIAPIEGYVLHDKGRDWKEEDPETSEWVVVRGYTGTNTSCGINYDFVTNPREFYAVPESEVPADHIFGGNNNPEIM